MIPTILSRVRCFNFKSRTDAEADEVIRRIFREERTGYRSLREYFLGRKSDMQALKQLASNFADSILSSNKSENLSAVGNFKDVFSQKRLFILFIEESVAILRLRLNEGRINARQAIELNELFRKALLQREQYNQSSQLVLESLFYSAVYV
jgi:DNA polymerase III gamma/tau subunit